MILLHKFVNRHLKNSVVDTIIRVYLKITLNEREHKLDNTHKRTYALLGAEGLDKLKTSRVSVFGLGGVGSYCAEALARCGIGEMTIIDDDVVEKSNINRQLVALHSTLGLKKVQVMGQRILDINPYCRLETLEMFYCQQTTDLIDLKNFDYIVDATDTISAKLLLAERAKRLSVPIISAMGTGNKLDPSRFTVSDIYDTEVCPLARIMRKELKKRGVKSLKVVYSTEKPIVPCWQDEATEPPNENQSGRPGIAAVRPAPGSVSFVPGTAGLIMAGEVVCDLIGYYPK